MSNDARTESILSHILPHLQLHKALHQRPFILGLTGLQGSGKSYLASSLVDVLTSKHNYNAIQVSLDDFYLPHAQQLQLRKAHPTFDLLQNRGQPSTHDTALAAEFFAQFPLDNVTPRKNEIWIPFFDKSLFSGDGDRVPREQWRVVDEGRPVDVLIFEGWSVGFRALPPSLVEEKWKAARTAQNTLTDSSSQVASSDGVSADVSSQFSTTTLADHELDELLFLNENLERYCEEFMGPQYYDFMVHLDTADLANVYTWRLQQEAALRKSKGTGMTEQGVVNFVKRYMPAYELYLDTLRQGFFRGNDAPAKQDAHLRVVLDSQRTIVELKIISNHPSGST